jgi:hypothetical protein
MVAYMGTEATKPKEKRTNTQEGVNREATAEQQALLRGTTRHVNGGNGKPFLNAREFLLRANMQKDSRKDPFWHEFNQADGFFE